MWQYLRCIASEGGPVRRDAMVFGARDTSDLISVVSFTLTMQRHLIRLAPTIFTSCDWAKFGWVPFAVCNSWQRSITENLGLPRVNKISGPILTPMWVKVHEIFIRRRRPLILSNALDRLSTSRFIQKIFAIKSRSYRKTELM